MSWDQDQMCLTTTTTTTTAACCCAIYARVSSEQQAKEGTIASQISALRRRVAEDGLALEESMCFVDDGYSGSTLVRPALERLRDLAAEGALARLYVLSPDRLARDFVDQMVLVDELRRCEVELVFVNRPLGDSPEDQLLLQVQGAMAQYERLKIMERCRRGRLHAARQGSLAVLGKGCYGYRYIGKQEGGGVASLNVVLEEAQVVRRVFEWIGRERASLAEVCRRLAKQGVLSPRGHVLWDRSTLWKMLKNPVYKGQAAYGKTRASEREARLRPLRGQGVAPRRVRVSRRVDAAEWIDLPAPALVSEELFEAVAEQLRENALRQRELRSGARYLLQGLVVCRCCGYAMIGRREHGEKGRIYEYYRCGGSKPAHQPAQRRCCWNAPVRGDRLEEAVWSDVVALLEEPGRLEEEFARRLARPDCASGEQRAAAARTAQLERSIRRLIDAYQEGILEKQEFEPRVKAARQRLTELKQEVQTQAQLEAQATQLRLVIGRVEDFARQVQTGLAQADWDKRRQIIRALVKEVEVEKDQVRIVYKVAPNPFDQAPSRGIWQDCCRRSVVAPRLNQSWTDATTLLRLTNLSSRLVGGRSLSTCCRSVTSASSLPAIEVMMSPSRRPCLA